MSFESLPSELVLLIFEYVGHDEFRRIDLLRVSKRWYAIARTVLYQDIIISSTSARLLGKTGPETIQIVRKNLRHISIDVNMIRDSGWPLTNRPTKTIPGNETSQMNRAFSKIGFILSKCNNLQQVTMRVIHNLSYLLLPVQNKFLIQKDIWNFVSTPPLENLTGLSIETYGFTTLPHPCESMGPRLYNLRRLWIRMDRLCPDLFLLGNGAATPATSRLERLIINLRRLNRDGTLSTLNAEFCPKVVVAGKVESPDIDSRELKKLMSEKIQALYAKFDPKCKFLRLIYYDPEAQGSKAIDFVPETVETVLSSHEEEYEGFREPENEDSAN
jgi:hypothetical protein